jgi:hypothetical protein
MHTSKGKRKFEAETHDVHKRRKPIRATAAQQSWGDDVKGKLSSPTCYQY